jgi:hypothetical protein
MYFASCERLCLHFQIHLRINICSIERDVPSQARIVLISTPARRRWVAVVCRMVCGLTLFFVNEGMRSRSRWTYLSTIV